MSRLKLNDISYIHGLRASLGVRLLDTNPGSAVCWLSNFGVSDSISFYEK